jgi:short-subunit dehydrogenase
MASYFCEVPLNTAPVYSAAKSFEDVISETLGYENPDMDILTVK